MAMGTRDGEQSPLWVVTSDLPRSQGHPFYTRLNAVLDANDFDRFVEKLCRRFYASVMGRPSLTPGRYFRLLLLGYFEGIDSERGIAWRAMDSLAVRSFLGLTVHDAPPDHSTMSRTRRLIDVETHRAVFTWVQERLVEAQMLKGKTIGIDATTLEGADTGDTTTIVETAIAAAEQIENAQADVPEPQPLEEIIADKGYHSNQSMVDLDAVGIRSYVAEPDRGRRDWSKEPEAQAPVYGNRRRIRGRRGRRLMRQRGERIERSFAHLYDTGGMRRTHLRGHTNILKRLLIHAGGFNLGLLIRSILGVGTPRGLQGRLAAVLATVSALIAVALHRFTEIRSVRRVIAVTRG